LLLETCFSISPKIKTAERLKKRSAIYSDPVKTSPERKWKHPFAESTKWKQQLAESSQVNADALLSY
jgi:hypothetical protein